MKNGGLILWNVTAICEALQTSWQMREHLMRGDLEKKLMLTGHPLTKRICVVQFVHKLGTHTQRALLKNCIVVFVRLKRVKSSGVFHVSSMIVLSRAFIHDHFIFFHPTYPTTQREHSVHPAHLQAPSVDKLRHQESLWREDLQSGGTRAPQLPQVMSPKNSRLSQGSKLILQIRINCMMYRKKLEKKITELLSPKKWRNLERLGRLVCWILKDQRRPTSNRRCMSTIPWKALQILISKMESYKKC